MDGDPHWAICRIGFVEVSRAVQLAGYPAQVHRFRADWAIFNVVDVDQVLAETAATLAHKATLRTLDALHLAAALLLPPEKLTVLTWDRRLHAAARRHGLTVLPAGL